ncbi:hypothetical protein F5B20DRAFT_528147 [Whalleya microplaca]|nr:hypothetical protein F5B20DRAFT_528147 [Whalleya microplaca]
MARKKACKECRQQKIRCHTEPPGACSRCQRMGLKCVTASNSDHRQTKAQLQRELDMLKRAGPSSRNDFAATRSGGSAIDPSPCIDVPSSTTCNILLTTPNHVSVFTSDNSQCSPRTFNGQEIEAREIQACFDLFFRDYSPFFPILEPRLSPDEYHGRSPFLFWTIIFIGSRRYPGDTTSLRHLGSKINSVALSSLESRASPIETIQGLLLLCLWPVPINTMHKDLSHILSGAAVHLATQVGLHVRGSGQDFARVKLDSDQTQKILREQLWTYCIMISQSTSLREGIPPLILAESTSLDPNHTDTITGLPTEMQIHQKMHDILKSATQAMLRMLPMTTVTSHSNANALAPFIDLYDSQLLSLRSEQLSTMNMIYLCLCRLHILTYYFLDQPLNINEEGFIRLYSAACSLIESIVAYEPRDSFIKVCPIPIERGVQLAAISILKVHRSKLSSFIDSSAGERAYFSAITLSRKASLEDGDLSSRAAIILSQLWASQSIFKCQGREMCRLGTRIRSRMSMSVVFDCFWWWREEFAGQPSPYQDELRLPTQEPPTTINGPNQTGEVAPLSLQPLPPADPYGNSFGFPEEPFPDYDWAANFDFNDFI